MHECATCGQFHEVNHCPMVSAPMGQAFGQEEKVSENPDMLRAARIQILLGVITLATMGYQLVVTRKGRTQ